MFAVGRKTPYGGTKMPWGPSDSIQQAVALTKSDTATFAPTRSVWVGGTGDLTVTMLNGSNATFASVPAGTWLPIQITALLSTGTAATGVLALY